METLNIENTETNTNGEPVAEKRKSLKDRAANMFAKVLEKMGIVDAPADTFERKNEYFKPTEQATKVADNGAVPETTVPKPSGLFGDRKTYTGDEPIKPAKEQPVFRNPAQGLFGGEAVNAQAEEQKSIGVQEAFDPEGHYEHLRPTAVKPQEPGSYTPEENPFRPPNDEGLYK